MMPRVIVLGTLRFPPENVEGIKPHLKRLVEETRRKDGCLAYDAAVDISDPGLIRFSESWPDRESLDRHLDAPHIGPWLEATRRYGLMSQDFTAYAISDSHPM